MYHDHHNLIAWATFNRDSRRIIGSWYEHMKQMPIFIPRYKFNAWIESKNGNHSLTGSYVWYNSPSNHRTIFGCVHGLFLLAIQPPAMMTHTHNPLYYRYIIWFVLTNNNDGISYDKPTVIGTLAMMRISNEFGTHLYVPSTGTGPNPCNLMNIIVVRNQK